MAKTVPLGGKKARGRVALVDDADYDLVMQYRWRVEERIRAGYRPSGPYAVAGVVGIDSRRTVTYMHKLLTGWPLTDHADHNTLNNQRHNLRPATSSQNNQNRLATLGAVSRYKGVTWYAPHQVWKARITYQGRRKYLGTFDSEVDAALAYDVAARMLFGAYAAPNFPELTSDAKTLAALQVEPRAILRGKSTGVPTIRGNAWMQAAIRKQRRQQASMQPDEIDVQSA